MLHRLNRYRTLLGSTCLALPLLACDGDDPTIIEQATAENMAGSPADSRAGGAGAASAGEAIGAGGAGNTDTTVEVSGDIASDTTWTKDKTYILTDVTFVVANSTLSIEPGTTILGGGVGSALIVTRGSRLEAVGTAAEPIVFSSNIPRGLRDPGDWGGVALLGSATTNVAAPLLEGIEVEGRGAYGGNDDANDCGTLKYVRIEFAGFELSPDNELNGLTLAGCGTGTTIDFVQVHRGSDDGIEIFGGKVALKHVVLSNNQDDSLDWDFGWTGQAQFVVVRHDADTSDAGFEADNGNPSTDVAPRSEPSIYNATLVGGAGSTSPGLVLRRGTWGSIHNAIITGFPVSGVDIRDAFSVAGTTLAPPRLAIQNSIFFQNGADGLEHADAEPLDGSAADDDGSFDEDAFLRRADLGNRFDVDPGLPAPNDVTAPNLVPPAGSPAASGGATPPAGFDVSASYVGALSPGGSDWTAGWTAYPEQ
jgi:hypothetical protein